MSDDGEWDDQNDITENNHGGDRYSEAAHGSIIETLKPCPFAHGANTHAPQVFRSRAWHFVVCGVCLAMGPRATTEAEAIAAWNRRASEWMPIETAPKDGTAILVYTKHGDILLTWFVKRSNPKAHHPWTSGEVTHWQPLPKPPKGEQ